MKQFLNHKKILLFLFLFQACIAYCTEPELKIHYLGHASFLFRFDNGVSVITDYGTSKAYGLNSPIYSFGDFKPTIVTYSHNHTDHYNPKYLKDCSHILTNSDSIELDSLKITPIRVSEANVQTPDNSAYLFSYKSLKVLHIADIQAYLAQISDSQIVKLIQTKFPDQYDLVFLTIDGVSDLSAQAEICAGLLKTKRIVPMHYWNPSAKISFLNSLLAQNSSNGSKYKIENPHSADYNVMNRPSGDDSVRVISLDPAKFDTTSTNIDEYNLQQSIRLYQNYPNPFHSVTSIKIIVPENTQTSLKVYDLQGNQLKNMIVNNSIAGEQMVNLAAIDFKQGVYIYKLVYGNSYISKRFEVIK
jgi:L-ascorbate metabolism protein UlaG (beta-lactamase superfamily)